MFVFFSYIVLVTEERAAMKTARSLSDELDLLEDREREVFLEFSNKVRSLQTINFLHFVSLFSFEFHTQRKPSTKSAPNIGA